MLLKPIVPKLGLEVKINSAGAERDEGIKCATGFPAHSLWKPHRRELQGNCFQVSLL